MASRLETQPIFDWTSHPAIKSKLRKEYRESILYCVLAFPAAALLSFLLFSDGLQAADAIFVPVLGLIMFWGVVHAVSAATFRATYVGIKVYSDGIALPWRSLADARSGRENFLSFNEIREVELVGKASSPVLRVVRANESKHRSFMIDSSWIPELDKFIEFLRGRLRVRSSVLGPP